MAEGLGKKISDLLVNFYGENAPSLYLELIVGGYSKGQEAGNRRYTEIYTLRWESPLFNQEKQKNHLSRPVFEIDELFSKDSEFGSYYGGQQWALDRFIFGIDDRMIDDIWQRRERLFDQACKYILKTLKSKGVKTPKGIAIETPGLGDFNVYNLISNFEFRQNGGKKLVQEMKSLSLGKLQTMERFFSLESAVSYCAFWFSLKF